MSDGREGKKKEFFLDIWQSSRDPEPYSPSGTAVTLGQRGWSGCVKLFLTCSL